MSRRHRAEKREVNPDPKFNDLVVSKFMNSIMKEGKKSVAERIVYGALDRMQSRAKSDPIQMFHRRSRTSCRRSRCARAASAAPPTRCRSRCAPSAARRWPSAG